MDIYENQPLLFGGAGIALVRCRCESRHKCDRAERSERKGTEEHIGTDYRSILCFVDHCFGVYRVETKEKVVRSEFGVGGKRADKSAEAQHQITNTQWHIAEDSAAILLSYSRTWKFLLRFSVDTYRSRPSGFSREDSLRL